MGTRNLTCVWLDGEPKVAQYCQWDGYPSGQGADALKFLKSNKFHRETFAKQVRRLTNPSDDAFNELWKRVGVTGEWANLEQSNKFKETWPHLQRDFGAQILEYIQDLEHSDVGGDDPKLWHRPEVAFAADSLFCEWAYVIDLDIGTFEVYRGFNKKKLLKRDRFQKWTEAGSEYHPVRLVAFWRLEELRDLTEDAFIAAAQAEKIKPEWSKQLGELTKSVGAPGILVTSK